MTRMQRGVMKLSLTFTNYSGSMASGMHYLFLAAISVVQYIRQMKTAKLFVCFAVMTATTCSSVLIAVSRDIDSPLCMLYR